MANEAKPSIFSRATASLQNDPQMPQMNVDGKAKSICVHLRHLLIIFFLPDAV
jgi:hypothetical protein